ncbi:MAG: FG-GAP repeat protein [Dehalococcoidia bacterium]|nr:FG-GAP repeat protein [Dehalococcoidia bacterium]
MRVYARLALLVAAVGVLIVVGDPDGGRSPQRAAATRIHREQVTAGAGAGPAPSYMLARTIGNPEAAAGDQFGGSVAAVGGNILVGALYDDPGGVTDAGSVYLFDGPSGALLLTIPNPAPGVEDFFGHSVAGVGGNILVGAYRDDPNGVVDAGSVYLFDGTSGALLLTIPNPSQRLADLFGDSVAAVGGNILVGAQGGSGSNYLGSAYLFDGTTGALLRTFTDPVPGGSGFGVSVAGVGPNVLVGAHLGAGGAYLFDGVTGAPLLTMANPAPGVEDMFGVSVAGVGGDILVGAHCKDPGGIPNAGSAYLFDGMSGTLLLTIDNPFPDVGDNFGSAVAGVGGRILVGASHDDPGGIGNAGSVYLFDGASGALLLTIPNPAPGVDDLFGCSVAGVGGNILVGAHLDDPGGVTDAGSAYLLCIGDACESPGPVGGMAELPDVAGSSGPPYAALAVELAAAVVALAAGTWYARRRWPI